MLYEFDAIVTHCAEEIDMLAAREALIVLIRARNGFIPKVTTCRVSAPRLPHGQQH